MRQRELRKGRSKVSWNNICQTNLFPIVPEPKESLLSFQKTPRQAIEIGDRNIEDAESQEMDLDSAASPNYRVLTMRYNNYHLLLRMRALDFGRYPSFLSCEIGARVK